ncbi:hypothetical protein CAPTEDRAFT_92324 [Capitella teleta]|uniref:Sodium/glucose cotransporter 4 n=1 Tax=Capitella teleta TaxID=283909 RepID=R7UGY6_CAPTE|nr:hypothetical protein CAPTEDRAFT_92324 [Capitella teleta]|eukprot:ELU03053.1 hypothetical protein CAPTEDRAFT_92324 [Capitella teleta]
MAGVLQNESGGTSFGKLDVGDIVVIVLYFALILFAGLWTSRKNRGSVGGYFLAGRNMHWALVGSSLFASNVGSLHFVGLAGSGAENGISIAVYELDAIFVVLMLGWLFLPVYIASGIYTMPEYLRKRFGGQRIRIYLAVLALAMYIFTKISADLFAGAIFIEQALGWNFYLAVILLLAIAALFTIAGGLTAVMWTDFIQTIIMMFGAVALVIMAFIEVGGFEGMRHGYERAIPNTTYQKYYIEGQTNITCGFPREDFLHLFRDPKTGDLPWPGIIGLTINSIWYWCADQVIVQRSLAAKDFSHAKGGSILCGYLKMLPLFILVFPGMIARILYTDTVACVDPDICESVCGSRAGCSNIAYPTLVLDLMPGGARGLMLAVMLSALMSSLTSIFNSSSTIFTIDIWRKIRKGATDAELLIVGRVCVLALVVISILWVPIIQASQGSQLFVYIQQVSSFLQPPICAVFLLAIFWSGITEAGAFWSLMLGLVAGTIRFVLEFTYGEPGCDQPDNRPDLIKNFHYLYFGIFLFLLTGATAVVVSLFGTPIHEKHLQRLTYWTRHSQLPREDIDTRSEVDCDGVIEDNKDENLEIGDTPEDDVPWWKYCFNWMCGIEKQDRPDVTLSEAEIKAKAAAMLSITEENKWRRFCAVNAVILMTLAVFLCGFFG